MEVSNISKILFKREWNGHFIFVSRKLDSLPKCVAAEVLLLTFFNFNGWWAFYPVLKILWHFTHLIMQCSIVMLKLSGTLLFLLKITSEKKQQPISYPGHFKIKIRNNICKYLSGDCSFAIFVMKITSAQFWKWPLGFPDFNFQLLDKKTLGKGPWNFHKANLGCRCSH